MSIQQTEFLRFLKLMSDNHCLDHVILVGSWAEFLYQGTSLLPGFHANLKTLDVDFLIRNLRRPVPAKNLAALARSEGYFIDQDRLTGTTRIVSREGLEIEFLINKTGAGIEHSLETNLGVSAQALRHMHILLQNTITVEYLGMQIMVPSPEAYIAHKMVIHRQRGKKQEKDKLAILNLWPHIDADKYKEIYKELLVKEKKEIDWFIHEYMKS